MDTKLARSIESSSVEVTDATTSYFAGSPRSSRQRPRSLRLFLAARDLAEPGSRSRAAYVVVFVKDADAIRPHLSNVTEASEEERKPPPYDGGSWVRVGQTEAARKSGRDVEFAQTFEIRYVPTANQLVKLHLHECTGRDCVKESHLGTAEVSLQTLYVSRGYRTTHPIKFAPTDNPKDKKRKGVAGVAVMVVEDVSAGLVKYHLDVQCEKILRAKAWTSGKVRKALYTIHIVASKDEKCDDWMLLFRSEPVEMVKRKRDGGSLQYNYFTSRPLIATPGVIVGDNDETENGDNLLRKVSQVLGLKHSEQFFSLPSAEVQCVSPERRLKLSIYEDNGTTAGFDLIADTRFTFSELRNMTLGQSKEVRVHSNAVGRATLKFVECGPDPKYFCMSVFMPHLR